MNLTNVNISISTAQRICKLFEASQSGSVESKPSNSRRYLHSLSEQAEIYLIGAILENPCMHLDELCLLIENVFNISVSNSTICRIIHKYGITRKKVRQIASQRCDIVRGAFMGQVLMFKRDMLVWVDESGSDKRTHIRKFGYSLRGTTPTNTRLLVRGERYNAIAAMSSSGVIALEIQKGTLNGEAFFDLMGKVPIPFWCWITVQFTILMK